MTPSCTRGETASLISTASSAMVDNEVKSTIVVVLENTVFLFVVKIGEDVTIFFFLLPPPFGFLAQFEVYKDLETIDKLIKFTGVSEMKGDNDYLSYGTMIKYCYNAL